MQHLPLAPTGPQHHRSKPVFVVGRHSGFVPGFRYSAANKNSGLVWDVNTLDRYLTGPRQVVPGTLMTYPGLKDEHQRADLIAYLTTLH